MRRNFRLAAGPWKTTTKQQNPSCSWPTGAAHLPCSSARRSPRRPSRRRARLARRPTSPPPAPPATDNRPLRARRPESRGSSLPLSFTGMCARAGRRLVRLLSPASARDAAARRRFRPPSLSCCVAARPPEAHSVEGLTPQRARRCGRCSSGEGRRIGMDRAARCPRGPRPHGSSGGAV